MIVDHEHLSSRFDRSMLSLRDYMEEATKRNNIITKTEVGNNFRDNALRRHQNWGVSQVEGPRGMSECAIVFDRNFYQPVRPPHTVALASKEGIGGEDTIQMIVSTYDTEDGRIRVGAFHGPAKIEGKFGLRKDNPDDVAAHREMMMSMTSIMRHWHHKSSLAGWMITGDLNLSVRLWWVRRYLNKQLPPYIRYNWQGHLPATGGTHGNRRVIDLTFYGKMQLLRTSILKNHESSDHNPFADAYLL